MERIKRQETLERDYDGLLREFERVLEEKNRVEYERNHMQNQLHLMWKETIPSSYYNNSQSRPFSGGDGDYAM